MSSPELQKAQVGVMRQSPSRTRMVVGVPIRAVGVENRRSMVDVRDGEANGKKRQNSLRAEIVGQHAF